MQSPVKSIHSLHAQHVSQQLQGVRAELGRQKASRRGSFSKLSQCVNDRYASQSSSPTPALKGRVLSRIVVSLPHLVSLLYCSQSGMRFDECYNVQQAIGEGGFATVYRCQHIGNHEMYAVKRISHEEYKYSTSCLHQEISAMKLVSTSPHIVRLHDVFYENADTYLVMEEVQGGDLLDRIQNKGRYDPAGARKVITGLLEAIRFLHLHNVCHRDIKLENILLTDATQDTYVKLCDFGCAKTVTSTCCFQTMAGSPQYAAPEIFEHEETGGYGAACDLWSVGVTSFVCLVGYAPFEEENMYQLTANICACNYHMDPAEWDAVPQEAKDLVQALLQVSVTARLDADQALKSKWLQRIEIVKPASFHSPRHQRDSVSNKLMAMLSPTTPVTKNTLTIVAEEKAASPRRRVGIAFPMLWLEDPLLKGNSLSSTNMDESETSKTISVNFSDDGWSSQRDLTPSSIPMLWVSNDTESRRRRNNNEDDT